MTQNRMHHRDRLRNQTSFKMSDNEYEIILQDMEEKGSPSVAAYIRAAIECYSGKKIFMERDQRKNMQTFRYQ